eukprot:gb/GECG01010706.1/.p1 GENE.gb/GECG01010706.1/~~gb/GECG01010706.1/.p1  ORF type:complete len:1699 (+),score=147.43 gb/GECG01010706.1/:1-5097(+)
MFRRKRGSRRNTTPPRSQVDEPSSPASTASNTAQAPRLASAGMDARAMQETIEWVDEICGPVSSLQECLSIEILTQLLLSVLPVHAVPSIREQLKFRDQYESLGAGKANTISEVAYLQECLRFGISELFFPGDIDRRHTRVFSHILALRRLDRWKRKQPSNKSKESQGNNFVQHSLAPSDFAPQYSTMDGKSRAPFSPSMMDYCDTVNKIEFIISTHISMEGRSTLQSYSEHAALYHGLTSMLGIGGHRRLWKFLISFYPELFFRDSEIKSWDDPPVPVHQEHWNTVKMLCREGVPEDCRGWCWFAMSGAYSRMLRESGPVKRDLATDDNFYASLCRRGMNLLSATEDRDTFAQVAKEVLGSNFNAAAHINDMRESFEQIKKDFRRTLNNIDPILEARTTLEYSLWGVTRNHYSSNPETADDDYFGGCQTLTSNTYDVPCPHKGKEGKCSADLELDASEKSLRHLEEGTTSMKLEYQPPSPARRYSSGIHIYGTPEANRRGRATDDCTLFDEENGRLVLFQPFVGNTVKLSEAAVKILDLPRLPTSLCYTMTCDTATDVREWLGAHILGSISEEHASYTEAMLEVKLAIQMNPSSLWRVLSATCLYLPSVGYCQGMNFIAAHALRWLCEEEAFWCLAQLIESLFPGRGNYFSSMEIVSADQDIVSSLMDDSFRENLQFLNFEESQELCQSISATTPRWHLCAFAAPFPPAFTDRLWDGLFQEGTSALFRTSLSIIKFVMEKWGPIKAPVLHDFIAEVARFPTWISKELRSRTPATRLADRLEPNISIKEAFAEPGCNRKAELSEESKTLWVLRYALQCLHNQDRAFFDGLIVPSHNGDNIGSLWLRPQPHPNVLTLFFDGIQTCTDVAGDVVPRPVLSSIRVNDEEDAVVDIVILLKSLQEFKALAGCSLNGIHESATASSSPEIPSICVPVLKLIYPADTSIESVTSTFPASPRTNRRRASHDLSAIHSTFNELRPRRASINNSELCKSTSTMSRLASKVGEKLIKRASSREDHAHTEGPVRRQSPKRTQRKGHPSPDRLQEAASRKFKRFQRRTIKTMVSERVRAVISQWQSLLQSKVVSSSVGCRLWLWLPLSQSRKTADVVSPFVHELIPLREEELSRWIWLCWVGLFGLKGENDLLDGFPITDVALLPRGSIFEVSTEKIPKTINLDSQWAQYWTRIASTSCVYRLEVDGSVNMDKDAQLFPHILLRKAGTTVCERACIQLLAILLRDISFWILRNVYNHKRYAEIHIELDANLSQVTRAAIHPKEEKRTELYPFFSKGLFGLMVNLYKQGIEESILPVLLRVTQGRLKASKMKSLVWSKDCEVSSSRLRTTRVALMAWNDHLNTLTKRESARGSDIDRLLEAERIKLQRGLVVNKAVEQLTESSFQIHCGMVEPSPSSTTNEDLQFVLANETQDRSAERVLSMKQDVPLYHGSRLYRMSPEDTLTSEEAASNGENSATGSNEEESSMRTRQGSVSRPQPGVNTEKRRGSHYVRLLRSVEQAKGTSLGDVVEANGESSAVAQVKFPCERKLAFWYGNQPCMYSSTSGLLEEYFLYDTYKLTYSVSSLAVALVCKFKNITSLSNTISAVDPLFFAPETVAPSERYRALSETYIDVIKTDADENGYRLKSRKNSAPVKGSTPSDTASRYTSFSSESSDRPSIQPEEILLKPTMSRKLFEQYMRSSKVERVTLIKR